jgi:hypothetical protein
MAEGYHRAGAVGERFAGRGCQIMPAELVQPRYDRDVGTRKPDQAPGPDTEADVAARIERLRQQKGVRPAPHTADTAKTAGPAEPASADFVARSIDRLRMHRVRPTPRLGIGPTILRERDRAQKISRRLGELIGLWEQLVDPNLLPHTTLTALRGGVLHVHVPSSSVAYELDRALREGLTAALRAHFRGALTRVKVSIAPDVAPNGRSRH